MAWSQTSRKKSQTFVHRIADKMHARLSAQKQAVHVPSLQGLEPSTPSTIFLQLCSWTIPYPYERLYYGGVLAALGWQWASGAYYLTVAGSSGDASALYMAHLDTVAVLPSQLKLQERRGIITTDGNGVLGGDDRCGVSLLLYLAHVVRLPGTYLLTTGEECGRQGFRGFLASPSADLIADCSCCFSFDRRGTTEIITHQLGEQTCSDLFADVLHDELRSAGLILQPSPDGLYTDSLELIGKMQIVNLSVGYHDAHSKREYVELGYLDRLGEAFAGLPIALIGEIAADENKELGELVADDDELDDWRNEDNDYVDRWPDNRSYTTRNRWQDELTAEYLDAPWRLATNE